MKEIGLKMLSSYEKNIVLKLKKSGMDKKIEEEMTKQTLKKMLNLPFAMKSEDGTEIQATALEFVIASAIEDAIQKGSFDKVTSMMKATGELTDRVEANVNISLVDQDLAKRAIE